MGKPNVSKYRILSGSALKVIACATMLIDHVACFLFIRFPWAGETILSIKGHDLSLYLAMRMIGRVSFPIFAFLLTEGFVHTHRRRQYGLSLMVFALISEIPWNLLQCGKLFFPASQNIFFTLLCGYLGMWVIERYRECRWKMALALSALFAVSFVSHIDYGCVGFGFILLLYVLRNNRIPMAVIGCCFLPSRFVGGTAFIPILMYNGKRGFVKGNVLKYAFYLFYPLHLAAIYLVGTLIF